MTEHTKYILQHVKISKMWGTHDISTSIGHINLFIGYNGTGKTTFINIIEAVACCDVQSILRLKFDQCSLFFSNGTEVVCTRFVDEDDDDIIEYSIVIDHEQIVPSFRFDASISTPRARRIRFSEERYGAKPERVKAALSKIINISWVSVERKQFFLHEYDNSDDIFRIGVDGKLDELVDAIQKYKSNIESEEKDLLDEFRKKVFELMLYDEKIDSIMDIDRPRNDNWSVQLKRAFHDLGITSLDDKIKSHVRAVNEGFKLMANPKSNIKKSLDAFAVVTLYKRTMSIVDLSKKLESERQKIREHFEIYISKLNSFINKKISGIHEKTSEGDEWINASSLSSGEKQIVILLSEMLLHKNENILFIADEPELSLHIDWQREIVGAIHELNKNAQLIFATHSPEVVSRWKPYVINMKTISSAL